MGTFSIRGRWHKTKSVPGNAYILCGSWHARVSPCVASPRSPNIAGMAGTRPHWTITGLVLLAGFAVRPGRVKMVEDVRVRLPDAALSMVPVSPKLVWR